MNQDDQPILDQLERLRSVTPDEVASCRAIKRARQSLIQQPLTHHWYTGRIAMIARIAACITLIAALGIIPLSGVWRSDAEGRLLASMIDNVKKSKNVSYRYTGRAPTDDLKRKGLRQNVYRISIDASGSYRKETIWGSIIVNRGKGKMMRLDQRIRRATLSDIPKDEPFEGVYDSMKNIDLAKYEKLEEKTIDGRKAIGFVVPIRNSAAGQSIHWIDVETKLPMRIEVTRGPHEDSSVAVIDQIVFDDPKVVAGLFEIKVPDGYQLQEKPLFKFNPGSK